ncbi:MAG: deoxyribonuclease IV [Planctomycetota bacterium]|nr:deoxyribonuclease IV [Planctomycetaceae bacterium]MDQ3332535.1 deoxyribonuclease IV [Planctomycetota bacterium]
MPLLGAHMSIAGGYHNAAEAAAALGMNTVQIFTKNNAQWKAKPITDEESRRFREAISAAGIEKPCSHASYLINMASPNDELWAKSVEGFAIELERAEQLGLAGVVVHPGTATGIDEQTGIENVVRALNVALEKASAETVEVWLETTAGQGASLGHRFEHLAAMLEGVKQAERFGICIDTCHLFAAGYPLISADEFAATFDEFDRVIGRSRLKAAHLNDSKKALGCRVDRHEHIGEGCLGDEAFRHLLNDRRFEAIPMYLETAKGLRDGEDLDAVNLRRLRGLIAPAKPSAGRRVRKSR